MRTILLTLALAARTGAEDLTSGAAEPRCASFCKQGPFVLCGDGSAECADCIWCGGLTADTAGDAQAPATTTTTKPTPVLRPNPYPDATEAGECRCECCSFNPNCAILPPACCADSCSADSLTAKTPKTGDAAAEPDTKEHVLLTDPDRKLQEIIGNKEIVGDPVRRTPRPSPTFAGLPPIVDLLGTPRPSPKGLEIDLDPADLPQDLTPVLPKFTPRPTPKPSQKPHFEDIIMVTPRPSPKPTPLDLAATSPRPTPRPVTPTPKPTTVTLTPVTPRPTAAATCSNEPWHKKGDVGKGCAWAGELPEKRCLTKDENAIYAFERCHKSCGFCGSSCEDSETWFKEGDPSKTCAWVARFRNRCAALGDNGRFAAEECRFSCATCDRPAEAACIEANFGTVIIESCGDSDAWHKKNDESKDCSWVAANTDRCTVKADGAVYAFEECKATCGTCGKRCVDDPTWHKAGEPLKTCAWAARFRNRCAATGKDGVTGFNACRRACKSCDYDRERAAVAACED